MTPASPRSLRHITSSDEANSAQRRCRCAMAKRYTASKDGIGPSWRPTGAFGVACRHAAFLAPSRSRQQCARVNTGAWLRLMKGLWTYLPFTETATSRVVSLSSVASHRMSNVMADPRFQKETGSVLLSLTLGRLLGLPGAVTAKCVCQRRRLTTTVGGFLRLICRSL